MSNSPAIVWFRLDLRLADNPALQAVIQRGGPVIPVFIHAPGEEAPWQPGAASRWWLHRSLQALDADLRAAGSKLLLRKGPSHEKLRDLVKETGATAVFWNRRYEPAVIARDATIKKAFLDEGIESGSFNGALLHEPWTIQNQNGKPFRVFTPFWKRCMAESAPTDALARPRKIPAPKIWPEALKIEAFELEPKINWAEGLRTTWRPGEIGARAQLNGFLRTAVTNYGEQRNFPSRSGTSRLSPHLHFGEISPRQIWHALRHHAQANGMTEAKWQSSQFLTELGWREFAHHLLFHFPHTADEPLRSEFKHFPWSQDELFLRAWRRGQTGYPIVDSGMRELWATGWMHNRVRMIVASFLVKDLLLSWTEGARWFWDTLVDADLAQNSLGWQWSAGCGADAAPYFRVFNPITQGEKFDPQGDYVRRWCPELAKLPDSWLHKPWQASVEILRQAGVRIGRDYPKPIVSHAIAREIALEAYGKISSFRQ